MTAEQRKVRLRELLKQRCVYTLPVNDMGEVAFCVTPLHRMRLFGTQPPRQIGCGVSGCAFTGKSPDRVVKITSDWDDVQNLIQAGPKHAPRVYAAYRDLNTDGVPVSIVEAERLKPVGAFTKDYTALDDTFDCVRFSSRRADDEDWKAFAGRRLKMAVACCKKAKRRGGWQKPGEDALCERIAGDTIGNISALHARGIPWADIHEGNIGWSPRDKRWKVFDLGFASKKYKAQALPQLQGARRR